MSQKIGLEIANGYIKVVSDDVETSYPNRLRLLSGDEFNLTGDLGKIYEFEGKQYIIDPNGTGSGGRNANRYLSKEYLLEALVAIAQVIKERNIILTIGVPCRDFRKTTLKENIINNLKGRHELKVINGKNTERFEINIEEVFVAVEPLGTLCDYVFNSKFEIVENRNESTCLIIDIGYSTTDILATNGLRIEKLHGADVGCMDITNQYLHEINSIDEEVQFTLTDIGLDNKPIIKKFNLEFNFTEKLNEVKENFVKSKLIPAIKECGINPSHYDNVIYTGGGALALKDQLELKFNEMIYPEPQMANARGFYKYTMIKKG